MSNTLFQEGQIPPAMTLVTDLIYKSLLSHSTAIKKGDEMLCRYSEMPPNVHRINTSSGARRKFPRGVQDSLQSCDITNQL